MYSRALGRICLRLRPCAVTNIRVNTGACEIPPVNGVFNRNIVSKSESIVSQESCPPPRLDASSKRLVVNIAGVEEEYPWVWLRDSCPCPLCYDPLSQSRIINLTEWDLNIKPAAVKVCMEIMIIR